MNEEYDVVMRANSANEFLIIFQDGDAMRMKRWDNPFHAQKHMEMLRAEGYEPEIWSNVTQSFDSFCEQLRKIAQETG